MNPDLQQEFRLLSEKAERQLKDVPVSGSYRRVFSFWVTPSFTPAYCCTLYVPRGFVKGKSPFASFLTWRSDLDYEKVRTPVERLRHPKDLIPTMEDETLSLTEAEGEDFQRRIRGISIPVYLAPSEVAGLDGTRFEFRWGEVLCGASLKWWGNQPEEWRQFTEAVLHVASDLESRRKGRVH